MSPPKFNNSTIKDLNDSKVDEISNNELKRAIIRIINEIKEDIYKHLN
jgi:Txe/YoeB family toxin of Txe-Axe toxin-antitoxin module